MVTKKTLYLATAAVIATIVIAFLGIYLWQQNQILAQQREEQELEEKQKQAMANLSIELSELTTETSYFSFSAEIEMKIRNTASLDVSLEDATVTLYINNINVQTKGFQTEVLLIKANDYNIYTATMVNFDSDDIATLEKATTHYAILELVANAKCGDSTSVIEVTDQDYWQLSTPASTATPAFTPFPSATATPVTTPEPSSMILSHTSYTSFGYFYVVGEVQNTLSTNIDYVKIIAAFYNSENTVIGTSFTYTQMDMLEPNQKSPFEISSYPDEITPASYKLTVDYLVTTNQPFEGLTILSHTPSYSFGYHQIVGEVRNNAATEANFVKIVCTYYDTAGKVIGTSFAYTNPSDINSGDTAPFELSSYPIEITPANYELQVQAN